MLGPADFREEARLQTYPPPYPNGWYHLIDSDEVAHQSAKAVEAFGERFLVVRDAGGTVRTLDGYCPHLGAELPEGRLQDGCLECPFHGWRIDACGSVRHVPYAERVSRNLAVKAFHTIERDGQIFVWRGEHGSSARAAPSFPLEPTPGMTEGKFVPRGSHDAGLARMHLLEFAENGADVRHFGKVHGTMYLPWTHMALPGFGVRTEPRWRLDEHRAHVAWLEIWAMFSIAGRPIRSLGANANIEFIGPGSVARFHFDQPGFGKVLLYQTHTPVAPLVQRVRFRWFASPGMPRAAVWWLVGQWVSQWRDDVRIWERKIHRAKPHLVTNDGAIFDLRRWFSQFYGVADHPRLAAARKSRTKTARP